MTISMMQSIDSESSLLHLSSTWIICLKNEYYFHNDYNDGDQNTNIPCDKLYENLETLKYDADLKQLKMKFPNKI